MNSKKYMTNLKYDQRRSKLGQHNVLSVARCSPVVGSFRIFRNFPVFPAFQFFTIFPRIPVTETTLGTTHPHNCFARNYWL